jgi:hypothetical protein
MPRRKAPSSPAERRSPKQPTPSTPKTHDRAGPEARSRKNPHPLPLSAGAGEIPRTKKTHPQGKKTATRAKSHIPEDPLLTVDPDGVNQGDAL